MNCQRNRHKGFTLLEMLLALSIFAILSTMAHLSLQSVTHSSKALREKMAALASVQKLSVLLERDFRQLVARPIRDALGEKRPALIIENYAGLRLEFTTYGRQIGTIHNALGFIRVAYEVKDNQLMRKQWLSLDRADEDDFVEAVVIKDFERLEVRILDQNGSWIQAWMAGASEKRDPTRLPVAIEWKMAVKHMAEITRLIQVGR